MKKRRRDGCLCYSRVWIVPFTTALILLVWFGACVKRGNWHGRDVGSCDSFCEINDSPVHYTLKQPVNTVSSFAFVVSGLVIAKYSNSRHIENDWQVSNLLTRSPNILTLYSIILVSVGMGSMFYHASGTAWSGSWDVVGQLPFVSFLAVYSLVRLLSSTGRLNQSRESSIFWYLYLTTTVLVSIPRLLVDIEYAGPIVGLVIAFLLLELLRYRHRTTSGSKQPHLRTCTRHLLSALICIVLGYAVLLLSSTGATWCRPHSPWQGHALWHLLSAASTVFLFAFLVTDCDDMIVVATEKESTTTAPLVG